MKILYVSDHLEIINGASSSSHSHLQILKEMVGIDNVYIISISTGKIKIQSGNNIFRFSAYQTKIGKIRNIIMLNHVDMNGHIIAESIKLIKRHNIKYAFVDESYFGQLVKSIKKKTGIPVFSFYHDVKAILYWEWIKNERKRRIPEFIVGILNERLTVKNTTFNITLNNRENTNFFNSYGKHSSFNLPVILKSHPEVYFHERNEKSLKLGFLGVYYYPNVKGITWFCKEVIPQVEKNVQLTIAGKGMEALKDQLERISPCIHVIGTVDKLSEFYSSVDVMVAPIFDGAGMKVKTAEAFSYGKAFLGSRESLVGYKDNLLKHNLKGLICECNTPEEYTREILRLSNDLKDNGSHAIVAYFEQYFSYKAAKEVLSEYLR